MTQILAISAAIVAVTTILAFGEPTVTTVRMSDKTLVDRVCRQPGFYSSSLLRGDKLDGCALPRADGTTLRHIDPRSPLPSVRYAS